MKIYRISANVSFQDAALNSLIINTDENTVKQRNQKAQEFIGNVIAASAAFRQAEAELHKVEEALGISIADAFRKTAYNLLANSDTFKFLQATNLAPSETQNAVTLFSDQGLQSVAKQKIDSAVGAPPMSTGNVGAAGIAAPKTK